MIHLLAIGLFLTAPIARAETADEIIQAARSVQRIDSSIQKIRMTLTSKSGGQRVREFEMRVRYDTVADGKEVLRSYARFSHPTDVAGTQLVVVDHPDRADEQLLYLPALKRTNRIAGKARRGAFMGSDFSYEDLEISGTDGAKHTLMSEDANSWIIETVPASDSSYTRLRSHVSKADYLPRKVEFFDKKGQALKVLEVLEAKRSGDHIVPTKSIMRHLQKGSSTQLDVLEYRLNVPAAEIPDETFSAAYMERHG